ncbi:MAG: signal recognition particle-docking protein FtsY [Anaerolineaceae bacterium]|nr:signal recognition particle-docking protein FtsY [Anaerolineae bacterium]MDX9830651.1 signal recognition particle-docking protein FtsY [Anaerolineae bacterium]NLF13784.1 signal recognition particle-docking protein FtsY [Anaerolineaceae bacterium]
MFRRSKKIRDSLTKTRRSFFGQISSLLGGGQITEETWEDLEALLVQADVGVETTVALVDRLREQVNRGKARTTRDLEELLKQELLALLGSPSPMNVDEPRLLTLVLVVGVNGSGKTTTIAKLAKYYKDQGRRVLLAAADTFRAAAIDQLKIWGERADVPVIAHQPGADPGAVVYDAIRASQSRKSDLLIVDTAGRLHTKYNLMEELRKVHGVAQKRVHQAPHETLLVLDATTGQNALSQARHFKDAVQVTGVVVAKLDGTAKGGMVFAIAHELQLPVRFVGTGETLDDLEVFDPEAFVEGLFES